MREGARETGAQRGYVMQPLWVLGLAFVVLGCVVGQFGCRCVCELDRRGRARRAVADFVAYSFAAQSLLTPSARGGAGRRGGHAVIPRAARSWRVAARGKRDVRALLARRVGAAERPRRCADGASQCVFGLV